MIARNPCLSQTKVLTKGWRGIIGWSIQSRLKLLLNVPVLATEHLTYGAAIGHNWMEHLTCGVAISQPGVYDNRRRGGWYLAGWCGWTLCSGKFKVGATFLRYHSIFHIQQIGILRSIGSKELLFSPNCPVRSQRGSHSYTLPIYRTRETGDHWFSWWLSCPLNSRLHVWWSAIEK